MVNVGSFLGYYFLKILYSTQRWDYQFLDPSSQEVFQTKPVIMSFWHNQQLTMPQLLLGLKLQNTPTPYVMISKHTDGRLIAKTVKRFNINSVAGSSTEGGKEALLALIDLINKGFSAVITPDGPRGPIYKLKRGVIQLAMATGTPIFPLVISTNSFWQFKSWDKMILPKPFCKGTFLIGKPITIARQLSEQELLEMIHRVESEMNNLMEMANCYDDLTLDSNHQATQ